MYPGTVLVLSMFLIGLFSCAPRTKIKEENPLATVTEKYADAKPTGLRRKIAVVEFENKTAYGKGRLGTSCADILTTELGKSNKFILVEREKMDALLKEKRLQESGAFTPDELAVNGKLLGLNAIVTGSISQFGVKTEGTDLLLYEGKKQIAEVTVDLRIVDVGTGKIIWTEAGKGQAIKKVSTVVGLGGRAGYDETLEGDALRAAIVKFVKNIIKRIDETIWSCYVAEVDNDKIYLDAGKESNLELGTKLKVVRPGKTITSPQTGLVIGTTEEPIGEIKVIEYFGDNGSIAKYISGSMPVKGDICKFK